MLTLQQIKADPARTIERLAIKGFDGKEPIAKVLQLDEQRRTLQLENDNLAAELNRAAASIGALMKQGKREEAEQAETTAAVEASTTATYASGSAAPAEGSLASDEALQALREKLTGGNS